MDQFFFADNTVLVNFGYLQRMDVLERLVGGRGRWCRIVSEECTRHSRRDGLGDMAKAWGFMGDPVDPSNAERQQTLRLRNDLREIKDDGAPHDYRAGDGGDLGEAETLAVMWERFNGSFFITDDRSAALRAAGAEDGRYTAIPVKVITTFHLLRLAARVRLLDTDAAYAAVTDLRRGGHGVPHELHSRPGWDAFIQSGVLNDWP